MDAASAPIGAGERERDSTHVARYPEISNRFKADLVAFGMLPRDVLTVAMLTTGLVVIVTSGAPTNLDPDYEMLADNGARSIDKGNAHSFPSKL